MECVVKEQINDFKSIHHLDQSEHFALPQITGHSWGLQSMPMVRVS